MGGGDGGGDIAIAHYTYYFVHGFQEWYPFTYLRNVALNNSHTNYVQLNDVDFVPKTGLQQLLKAKIAKKEMTFNSHVVRKSLLDMKLSIISYKSATFKSPYYIFYPLTIPD